MDEETAIINSNTRNEKIRNFFLNNRKILFVILSLILLNSCTGFSDAIQGKKRSENSDEFLVQKKNPLTAPPDMDELPVPSDQEKRSEEISNDDSDKIKKALNLSLIHI